MGDRGPRPIPAQSLERYVLVAVLIAAIGVLAVLLFSGTSGA